MTGLFAGYRHLGETETAAPAIRQAGMPANLPARSDQPSSGPDWPVSAATRAALGPNGLGLPRLYDVRTRQWEAERARAQQVLVVVMELANAYCSAQYNAAVRTHGDLLYWPVAVVKVFVETVLQPSLEARHLAADPALAGQHQALRADYDALQTEHNRLRVAFELDERELAVLRKQRPASESDEVEMGKRPSPPAAPARPESEDEAEQAERDRTDDLMRLIASTGVARLARIREKLATAWRLEPRGAALRNAINGAIKAQYIKLFDIPTDWQGSVKSVFVELSATGIAYVRSLGVEPAESEIKEGLRRGFDLAQLNLILRAADMLKAEGYTAVRAFPERVRLLDGQEHHPALAVVDAGGQPRYVECERESSQAKGDAHWQRAAIANNGAVWLITTTPALQTQLVSEINLARSGQAFSFLACNVGGYLRKERGKDGSMWTERN